MTKPVEVAIVSGKGGTGKTVFVSSLARVIESKVLADCDVDAPDLHLLLSPATLHEETFTGGSIAVIGRDKCNGCGECSSHCRFGAVREVTGADGARMEVDEVSCEGCALCYYVCPENAVEMCEKPNGKWYISDTSFGPFVHARLDPAEENSGKLVSIVRREARKIAAGDNLKYIIVDGPPGIGCPVISSIAGTDLVIIVAEPTVSGIHDCERVASLARHFRIPAAGLINKYDINEESTAAIIDYFKRHGITLLGKIPFGIEVNRAIARGELVVDYDGSAVAQALTVACRAVASVLEGIREQMPASK